ncbi:MAG: hypothetical protein HYS18_13620 [Burkholderiales bacterium]|nr:hypothetical protein [Burkholderiales bacterium]
MLGEMIGDEQGKITSVRVLPFEGNLPRMEVTFQAQGKLVGVDTATVGTYIAVMTPAGVYNGAGQGIVTTGDGETLTWTGTGVGKPTGQGMAASWRGSIYYQTTSQRLAALNKMALIFEYEVDENGNTADKLWEWK